MTTETPYHIPVMLRECIEGLAIKPDGTYVDVTFGGGGHSGEILASLGENGRLFGFDQDEDALQNNLNSDPRFTFVRSNFRYLKNFLRYHQIEQIDGLLADLGVSSHQFDEEERGFSFRFDKPLDMRMNQKSLLSAFEVINQYEESKLADIFFYYGELKPARKMASVICKARAEKPIRTTGDLINTVSPLIRQKQEKKELAQLFQAIRIEVNGELKNLKEMLSQALEMTRPGGRIVVMTYHSLEDRLVKNFFKTGNFEGKEDKDFFGKVHTPFRLINNKVIIPGEEEIAQNPRSRSAKLRIAEKL
ncbi:MAG: 16S rRNA (cytosine(1402)-N(4))-methyltransferase RsmH [Bacteroidales bacterium]